MSKIFFTVGPTQLYPTVKKHILQALKEDIGSTSHRSEQFQKIYSETASSLKELMCIPDDFQIFFLGSATEAMERIIQNCVKEHSFHFVNGAFSKRFFEISRQLGKNSQQIESAAGDGFNFREISVPEKAEMICLTQNETSTGTSIPMKEISKLRKRYPDKLIAVDIVSSAPYAAIDFESVDCAFFSVQKGFGLPAGLGVLIVNRNCLRKSEELEKNGVSTGSFHSFSSLRKYAESNQTSETPNVLGIYLLGKVARDLFEYGIERIRKETDAKAKMIYGFFEKNTEYSPFISDEKNRSKTIAVINTPDGSRNIIENMKKNNIFVSTGYKENKKTQIRIANFPAHSLSDTEYLLQELSKL
jgi:phosphoserine aminotransferase